MLSKFRLIVAVVPILIVLAGPGTASAATAPDAKRFHGLGEQAKRFHGVGPDAKRFHGIRVEGWRNW